MTKKMRPIQLSTLDDFLAGEGKREEFEAVAVKEILAWQLGITVHSIDRPPAPRLRSAVARLETARGQSLDAREKAIVAERSVDAGEPRKISAPSS